MELIGWVDDGIFLSTDKQLKEIQSDHQVTPVTFTSIMYNNSTLNYSIDDNAMEVEVCLVPLAIGP